MTELLRAYNHLQEDLGLMDRLQIHQKGLWHKVIYSWILHPKGLIFSQRSSSKKYFPHKLFISSSGHYQEESPLFQEVKEELGIEVSQYIFLGRRLFIHEKKIGILDREFQDLYLISYPQEDFTLEESEIEAIFFFPLHEGLSFFSGDLSFVKLQGISSQKESLEKTFVLDDFMPNDLSFYLSPFHYALNWQKRDFQALDLF